MARVDKNDIHLIRRLSPLIGVEYPADKQGNEVPRSIRLKVYGAKARAARATALDSLTLSQAGFLGNNVTQLVHGLMIAEEVGILRLRHEFPMFGPAPWRLPVRLTQGRAPGWRREVGLRGRFFARWNNAILMRKTPAAFLDTLDRYLRPAFAWATPPEPGLLVLNLRGGEDIFARPRPPDFYGQPPLSYYIAAAEAVIQQHDIRRIAIVHQDRLNPVLPGLATWASQAGRPFSAVSAGPEGDARALLGAEHIVMGCTTFTEAMAMLSEGLVSLTTFGRQHLFEVLDLAVPIRRRFEDDGSYLPTRKWTGSDAERAQMLEFPAERLTMTEKSLPAALERRERLSTSGRRGASGGKWWSRRQNRQ